MKSLLACSLAAGVLLGATPVFAQGVYIGPGGVAVDPGFRHHHDYDRYRQDDYRRRHFDEGRSAYQPYHRDSGYYDGDR